MSAKVAVILRAVDIIVGRPCRIRYSRRWGSFRLLFPLAHFPHRHDKVPLGFKAFCYSFLLINFPTFSAPPLNTIRATSVY